jgi:uncharacterized protein DUF2846
VGLLPLLVAGAPGVAPSDRGERAFPNPPQSTEALVYLYRPDTPDRLFQGGGATAHIDMYEIGELLNDRYTFVYVAPGPHTITIQPDSAGNQPPTLSMIFRPGRTYFIRFTRGADPSGRTATYLLSVSEAIGRREIEEWCSFLPPRTSQVPVSRPPVPASP